MQQHTDGIAMIMLAEMRPRDVGTDATIIVTEEVISFLEPMQRDASALNVVTCSAAISACKKGQQLEAVSRSSA